MRFLLLVIGVLFLGATNGPSITYTATATPVVVESPRLFSGTDRISHFLRDYYEFAKKVEFDTGVPSTVILSVAALESNWGRSGLSKKHNNFFGRKAIGSEPVALMSTLEYRKGRYHKEDAAFKYYPTPKESFLDFAKLMATKRYSHIHGSVEDWAVGLQQAGYATDPTYAEKVVKVSQILLSRY